MKVEDLMIGDWVLIDGEIKQVQSITDTGGINPFSRYGEDYTYYNPEPIPLTTEILLRNGFKEYSGGGCIIKELTDDEMPTLFIWYNSMLSLADFYSSNKYTDIFECNYVHELQHVLKLCKIEKNIVL